MYRTPLRPTEPNPGVSRPPGRFPSPASSWARSPSSGLRYGASPRGSPVCSPGSPRFSPGFHGPYRSSTPTGFGSPRGFFPDSSRGFGGRGRGRADSFRRPRSFGPAAQQNLQAAGSEVEKYFSPSMLQDPWFTLQPITAAVAARR
ncbi:M-phase-specific PLK1-interacting protein [Genypterus blacodes]|uniref:M-phase-specific PLK1-interacting protein n=1 Tax=Genypterus blacodes TaxID=154954 RepID=UPI003F767D9A